MSVLLDKIIQDFADEIDTLKDTELSVLRSTLKRVLWSLQLLEEVVLDGHGNDPMLKTELLNVLKEAENELGALLRSDRSPESDHDQRLKFVLIRISEHRDTLVHLPSSNSSSFHIPLFTRSESFKSMRYEPPDSCNANGTQRISIEIEKETIKATITASALSDAKKDLAPPRPPPPPAASKERCKMKKTKPEIARQPTVLKLFHSFRSRATLSAPPQTKATGSKFQKGDNSAVIAELMSRSKHAQRINREVEMHSEKINNWATEIKTTHFNSMEEVDEFVQRMDKDMNETLTDEVVILKRVGNWPKRYDVLREARASWKQLKDMESKMLNWKACGHLKGQLELEHTQKTIEDVDSKLQGIMRFQQREEARYREAGIPWTRALYDRVKAAALVPIEIYLQTVLDQAAGQRSVERQRQLFSKCAVFAFKGHQFVGGFNEACSRAFASVESAAHSVINFPEPKDLNQQCPMADPVASK